MQQVKESVDIIMSRTERARGMITQKSYTLYKCAYWFWSRHSWRRYFEIYEI